MHIPTPAPICDLVLGDDPNFPAINKDNNTIGIIQINEVIIFSFFDILILII